MPRSGGDGTTNEISGQVENAVQAQHIGTVNMGVPAAPSTVPRHVPPPPQGFVDRVGPLAEVGELVDAALVGRDRPGVVALRGMPGVGKSAFLRKVGAQYGDRFVDGALHIDFSAFRHRGGVAVGEAAGTMLRALRVADAWIPPDLAGRTGMCRSLASELNLLVVFDGVTDGSQVLPFVPPRGRSLVVTASTGALPELIQDGAVDLKLDELSPADSLALLAEMCPDGRVAADPSAAADLARLCGHLPLALRVAGASLKTRPTWSVDRLLAQFDDEPDPFDGLVSGAAISGVFDLAYDDLDDTAGHVYRMAGLLVGSHLPVEVVAALCDLPVRRARRALDELAQASLLTERPDGTYEAHRLVQAHALRRSQDEDTDEDRRAALWRALRWWLARAVAADVAATSARRLRVADPNDLIGDVAVPKMSGKQALDWLEHEHANLLGLMRACAEQGWHDPVWQLFEALFAYYDNRQPLAAWTEAGELAVAAAGLAGNPAAEARARCQLARALQKQGRYSDAHEHLDRARELAESLADGHRMYASTLDFTGNLLFAEGKFAEALDSFQRGLAINERLGLPRAIAMLSLLSGRVLVAMERAEDAIAVLATARRRAEEAGDPALVARIALATAAALGSAGRTAEAEQAAREARLQAHEFGATAREADACVFLARLARDRGDHATELELLELAEQVYATMGSPLAAQLRTRQQAANDQLGLS